MVVASSKRSLNVLICGGGVAGPALAHWLIRGGHRVTVVERSPALRDTGAQVDLRAQGVEAIDRMGLLDTVKAKRVNEPGVRFVNDRGRSRGTIMANTSGRGRQTLTSEYEIMRGDLVRVLYDATRSDTDYVFGTSVHRFEHHADGVVAHFADGTSKEFDLLVGADGQGSRTRDAMLPADSPSPYRRLGLHIAYWSIPRMASDRDLRDTYHAPGGRMIFRRSHDPAHTQVYFILRETSEEASAVHRESEGHQRRFWAERFRDAGWQTDRFIDGMRTTESFYSQEVVQVQIPTWSRGRAVLLGDAAHCASPFSGMGVSGGLVGAYVLGNELNTPDRDVPAALAGYEARLRPFVDRIQATVRPRVLQAGIPRSPLGVRALHVATTTAGALHLPDLVARLSPEDRGGDWQLPDPAEAVSV